MLIFNRIFGFMFAFWKFVKKTKMHPLAEMDLLSGKAEIDALESTWEKPVPKNFLERVSALISIKSYNLANSDSRFGSLLLKEIKGFEESGSIHYSYIAEQISKSMLANLNQISQFTFIHLFHHE